MERKINDVMKMSWTSVMRLVRSVLWKLTWGRALSSYFDASKKNIELTSFSICVAFSRNTLEDRLAISGW